MKKISFLIKLYKKKILKVSEPSDEVRDAYIQKSRDSLKSSEILLQNNQINDSITLAYYSMYNMLTALLCKIGIKCENHAASIIILKELFNQDNTEISFAKNERLDKQYYIDFKATRDDAESLIKMTSEFNAKLYNFIDNLTTNKVLDYRDELIKMLKCEE